MRINTQQRQVTVPFSDGRGHFHTFTCEWAPAKQLPDKANCRTAFSYQYWFWSGFIASLVTPHIIISLTMLVPHGTHVRISTCTLVATVSSHARIMIIYDSSCLICMFYGREKGIKFNLLQWWNYCGTLHMCQRVHTGESYIFILVIYMQWAFKIANNTLTPPERTPLTAHLKDATLSRHDKLWHRY